MNDDELLGLDYHTCITRNLSTNHGSRDMEWPTGFNTTLWWFWRWRNYLCFERKVDIPVDQLGFIRTHVDLIRQALNRRDKAEGSIFNNR